MKIHFIITQDIDSPSGLGRFFPLARELVKKGHKVTISALHPNYFLLKEKLFVKENVLINYIAPMHVLKQGSMKKYYSDFKLIFIVIWEMIAFIIALIKEKSDLVFVGKPHPMNTFPAYILRFFNNKSIWIDCDDFESATNRFNNKFQLAIISFVESYFVPKADFLSVNTQYMYIKAKSWGMDPNKMVYLPNGIDIDRFREVNQKEVRILKNNLGLINAHVVGYVGSFSLTSHPIDLLIEAFSIVVENFSKVRLLLVGGGENLEDVKELVEKKKLSHMVIFTGKVPSAEIGKYYRAMNVSVDPVHANAVAASRSPLKMFESWYCGVPFITGDIGDRRLLAGEPPASLIVPPGDESRLAEGIIKIITNPSLSYELRLLGKNRIKEFTWEKLVEKITPNLIEIQSQKDTSEFIRRLLR